MKSINAIMMSMALAAMPVAVLSSESRTDSPPMLVAAAADQAMTDGEIRKVEPTARKITIRHGELKNLDMPPMTMVFQVSDPAMLEKVKAGDKVKFHAEKVNGAFTVMEIEVIK
jgi:Cu/Ag efflux protein CusF